MNNFSQLSDRHTKELVALSAKHFETRKSFNGDNEIEKKLQEEMQSLISLHNTEMKEAFNASK